MNKKPVKILVVSLVISLILVSGIAYGEDDADIMLINYEAHWAQPYVDNLKESYDLQKFFENKDFDSDVSTEDFINLVQKTLKEDYEYTNETITREEGVHELTKIWAEKVDKELDIIPTIKMIIYSDTEKINTEYNHSITVAYMKEIAKGRGDRVFDPKANLTYGEVVTLIVNTQDAVEKELEYEESIMKGTFETRGDYRITDEGIVFDFELFNHYEEAKTLMFNSGQQFEITITNESNEEVYKYSEGKIFTMALVYETIEPVESLNWQNIWDMTDKEDEKVGPGEYTAKIKIIASIAKGIEETEETEEIEETETIAEEELTKILKFTIED